MRERLSAAMVVLALVVGLLLISPGPVSASVMPLSVEELTRLSDLVVLGRVVSIASRDAPARPGSSHGFIYTDAVLQVEGALKGSPGAQVKVTTPGGTAGGLTLRIPETATFAPGDRCLLFVSQGFVAGDRLGKIDVEGRYVPALGGSLEVVESRIRDAAGVSASWFGPSGLLAPAAPEQSVHAAATAVITTITPLGANAGTGEQVTIEGSDFGSVEGTVTFYYDTDPDTKVVTRTPAKIVSWSPTSIVCKVPANASSGPVTVTTAGGIESGGWDYPVGFAYQGSKWAAQNGVREMRYRINPNCQDAVTNELELVQLGASVWNDAGTPFHFTYTGTCASTGAAPGRDGHNDIYWDSNFPPGSSSTLAWNEYWLSGSTVIESDLILNDRWDWGDGSDTTTYDIASVAAHELGHSLSLLDQYGKTGDRDKIMYGVIAMGTQKRTLSAADLAGIRYIYPDSVEPPPAPAYTSLSIRANATSVRIGRSFVLSGYLSPGFAGDLVVADVRKPRSSRWSYSSARGLSSAGAWWYRYTFKRGMARGTYYFRARYLGESERLPSTTRTIYVRAR